MSETDVQFTIPKNGPLSNDFSIDDILAQINKSASQDPGGQPIGGGQGPIPMPFPEPIKKTPPEGITMGAQGEFRTKGAHQRASIGSLFGNITSIATKALQNQQEKKARQVQFDMERIITILQTDPGLQNPNNQKIINDIANDPKKLKAMQKALGIDFLKPDKNANSPERKGAQAAFQGVGKQDFGATNLGDIPTNVGAGIGNIPGGTNQVNLPGGAKAQPTTASTANAQGGGNNTNLSPQAQALIGMFPQGPRPVQLSQEEQLQAQRVKAGLIASADKRLEAFTKVLDGYMRSKATMSAAQLRSLAGLQIAAIAAESRLEAVKAHVEGSKDIANKKIDAAKELENLRHQHRISEITKRHDLISKTGDKTRQDVLIKEQAAMVDGVIKDLQLKLKSEGEPGRFSSKEKKDSFESTKKQLEGLRSYRQTLLDSMGKLMQEKGVSGGGAISTDKLADEGSDLLTDDDEEQSSAGKSNSVP